MAPKTPAFVPLPGQKRWNLDISRHFFAAYTTRPALGGPAPQCTIVSYPLTLTIPVATRFLPLYYIQADSSVVARVGQHGIFSRILVLRAYYSSS